MSHIRIGIGFRIRNAIQIPPVEAFGVSLSAQLLQDRAVWNSRAYQFERPEFSRIIGIAVVAHHDIRLKPTNARRGATGLHDAQTVAVLVMFTLEFESHLALGLGNSDSRSTLARRVMRTHVCARNFGHLYRYEEIEVVGFPNVSWLHVRSRLVHEFLCFAP